VLVPEHFFFYEPPAGAADSVRPYNLRRSSRMCVRHVVRSSISTLNVTGAVPVLSCDRRPPPSIPMVTF
jgi:hypothetical protein